MNNLIEIIAQTDDFKLIRNEIDKDMLSKTVLLESKDSLYLSYFAKTLAIYIEDRKIEEDSSNYIKILNEVHGDVLFFPKKDKLLVADSEQIIEESFIKPTSAPKKIFIINNIDNSMESAQNKLLKILEEPPRNVFFILTCQNIEKVLPTVRSRCNKIELKKLEKNVIVSQINYQGNVDKIINSSDGLLGQAIYFSQMKDFENLYDLSIGILTNLKNTKQVLEYSKKLEVYFDRFDIILNILGFALEDILYYKYGLNNNLRFSEELLKTVSDEYSIKAISQIQNLIDKAYKEKSFNVNTITVIENLLLKILEVKFLCK